MSYPFKRRPSTAKNEWDVVKVGRQFSPDYMVDQPFKQIAGLLPAKFELNDLFFNARVF
jgi:hypothetical protein